MRLVDLLFGMFLCGIAIASQGCALTNSEGFEFRASAGLHAVDTHQASQATHAQPCGGLRGWWYGCDSSMEK